MESEVVVGTIRRVLVTRDDWRVLSVFTNAKEDIICKGVLENAKVGDELEFQGQWKTSTRNGKNEPYYDFTLAVPPIPTTRLGVAKYLKSIAGEKTANEILHCFGDDALSVLDNDPIRLLEVPGIGQFRYKKILAKHESLLGNRDTIVFFKQFDLTMTMISKIIATLGKDAVHKFQQNPYILTELYGVGFEKADVIARKAGVGATDTRRVEAGALHLMRQALDNDGHCYLPLGQLARSMEELLTVSGEHIIDSLHIASIVEQMVEQNHLSQIESEGQDQIYLPYVLKIEKSMAQTLLAMNATPRKHSLDVEAAIAQIEGELGIHYAESQKAFLRAVMEYQVVGLTGGPGTGKTTVLKGALRLLDMAFPNDDIMLCAPTGKAAKRMSQSTGREAKTMHRMLEVDGSTGKFRYNEFNKLPFQRLVGDEFSMLDLFLGNNLLKAIEPSSHFIMVGDPDQLPSVGAGAVLLDLIQSQVIPFIRLTEIFRQAQDSGIVVNAYRVNRGEFPNVQTPMGDFQFISTTSGQAQEDIRNLVERYSWLYDVNDLQVLTPVKNKKTGVIELNNVLQDVLNPKLHQRELRIKDTVFREGDKVMQMRNNYNLEVFNGDSGVIEKILDAEDEDGEKSTVIQVRIDDQMVEYDLTSAKDLQLAYACTIHKSQGSEWKCVVIPIFMDAYVLLKRNLLYTAITRAKERCIVIGDPSAIRKCVKTLDTSTRYTNLARWLREAASEMIPAKSAV